MVDSDMAGPIVFLIVLGFCLLLVRHRRQSADWHVMPVCLMPTATPPPLLLLLLLPP